MFRHLKRYWEQQGIDPDEYVGNMWGWKVSYIGLAVMLLLGGLYWYRSTYHPQEVQEVEIISTGQIDPIGRDTSGG